MQGVNCNIVFTFYPCVKLIIWFLVAILQKLRGGSEIIHINDYFFNICTRIPSSTAATWCGKYIPHRACMLFFVGPLNHHPKPAPNPTFFWDLKLTHS